MQIVYGLVSPEAPKLIRYVGQTSDSQKRLLAHCGFSGAPALREWAKELRSKSYLPKIVVLAEVEKDKADETELQWIEKLRVNGQADLNSRPGRHKRHNQGPLSLARSEADHIQAVLKMFKGNRTHTAAALGISRRALIYKLNNTA